MNDKNFNQKFFGSKLNTVLLLVLIILLGVTIYLIKQNKIETIFDKPSVTYSWNDVVGFAKNCEIQFAGQSHALDVDIKLKNGKEFTIKEPSIDRIYNLLQENSDKCGMPGFATE